MKRSWQAFRADWRALRRRLMSKDARPLEVGAMCLCASVQKFRCVLGLLPGFPFSFFSFGLCLFCQSYDFLSVLFVQVISDVFLVLFVFLSSFASVALRVFRAALRACGRVGVCDGALF